MSYAAQIVKLENVRPHSNADKVQLATAGGYTVVIGLDHADGDIGILFPPDGKLSPEFLAANDLVSYIDEGGNRKGGFFDEKGRVRAQSFRGEKSEAFWIPVSSLDFIPGAKWELGMLFDTINDIKICEKYFTPATLKAMKGGTTATKRKNVSFHEHYDTTQLRHYMWPKNAIVYVTYKLHGTSGRTAYVMDEGQAKHTLLQKLFRRPAKTTREFKVLNGTRRTILKDGKPGFYADESFRLKTIENIVPFLKKNEVIYYELVGYTSDGGLIMGEHDVTKAGDKELVKQYGKKMRYTYGQPEGTTGIYVYHIKHVNEDGDAIDLSWPQVVARCQELGLNHVPELEVMTKAFNSNGIELLADSIVKGHADGPDPICPAHVREGIVFRIEHDGVVDFVKQKGFTFCVLEGIIKQNDDYVDTEEIS